MRLPFRHTGVESPPLPRSTFRKPSIFQPPTQFKLRPKKTLTTWKGKKPQRGKKAPSFLSVPRSLLRSLRLLLCSTTSRFPFANSAHSAVPTTPLLHCVSHLSAPHFSVSNSSSPISITAPLRSPSFSSSLRSLFGQVDRSLVLSANFADLSGL